MFGYVTVNREKLTDAEYARFKAYYCGLCRALRRSFGSRGRVTLSYDMAFLALLLSALYEPEESSGRERCALHPVKTHPYVENEFLSYAADMNLALAYHKCADDWEDDKSVLKLGEEKLLRASYRAVSARYPRQTGAIERAMESQREVERRQAGIDESMSATSAMLGELYAYRDDLWADALRRIGASLGRFIYFMDAYEDLPRDAKKGAYNPLLPYSARPDYEDMCARSLTLLIAECTDAFETLPLERDLSLLRNVLYSGVWSRYASLRAKKEKDAARKLTNNA